MAALAKLKLASTVSVLALVSVIQGNSVTGGDTAPDVPPTPTMAPSISGPVTPGGTVTIIEGTYTGDTPITVTGTLTLDGLNVTMDMVSGQYDIPPDAEGKTLQWNETASNGVAPDATQTASATVNDASFLLDIYPGALAAYSLRRLSSSATQVVDVRRSSDGAEAGFTPEEVEDGTLAAFCGSGDGFAVRLYDQSGNGNHAFQNTAVKQPKVVSSGSITTLNGQPSPVYTESNETQMVLPSGAHALAGSTNKTLITVATASAGGSGFYRTVYIGQGGSSKVTFRFSDSDDSVLTFNGFSNTVGFTMSTDQPYISWSHDIAGSQEVFLNGYFKAGNSGGGTNTADEGRLGGYLDSNFWNGPVADVIMYSTDMSANRTSIEAELSDVFGIATNSVVPAEGGTITEITDPNDGLDYYVHTFTNDGTFKVNNAIDVEYFILGGGGSGPRASRGAGGGAGGTHRMGTLSLSPGTNAATIGDGGLCPPDTGDGSSADGNPGGSSSVFGITAPGGTGGTWNPSTGGPGGDGGDNADFSGGTSDPNAGASSGGGAGSNEAGNDYDNPENRERAGDGGDGVAINLRGLEEYFGGGGGGGAWFSWPGKGGLGGGTDGPEGRTGGGGVTMDAAPGTGAGAGGAFSFLKSGDGGSGIIIIRYRKT